MDIVAREGISLPVDARSAAKAQPYRHPMEVAYHAALPMRAKRAILARWASETCALEGASFMRRDPRTGLTAPLDEIMDALFALEEEAAHRTRVAEVAAPPKIGVGPRRLTLI